MWGIAITASASTLYFQNDSSVLDTTAAQNSYTQKIGTGLTGDADILVFAAKQSTPSSSISGRLLECTDGTYITCNIVANTADYTPLTATKEYYWIPIQRTTFNASKYYIISTLSGNNYNVYGVDNTDKYPDTMGGGTNVENLYFFILSTSTPAGITKIVTTVPQQYQLIEENAPLNVCFNYTSSTTQQVYGNFFNSPITGVTIDQYPFGEVTSGTNVNKCISANQRPILNPGAWSMYLTLVSPISTTTTATSPIITFNVGREYFTQASTTAPVIEFDCINSRPTVINQASTTPTVICTVGKAIVDKIFGGIGQAIGTFANQFSTDIATSSATNLASSTSNMIAYITTIGTIFVGVNNPITNLLDVVFTFAIILLIMSIVIKIIRTIRLR